MNQSLKILNRIMCGMIIYNAYNMLNRRILFRSMFYRHKERGNTFAHDRCFVCITVSFRDLIKGNITCLNRIMYIHVKICMS